jgi:hypothetical protein
MQVVFWDVGYSQIETLLHNQIDFKLLATYYKTKRKIAFSSPSLMSNL